MKVFQYTIKDEVGIHAGPAGMLAEEAKQFSSRIFLECGGKKAEATKLMAIMDLGARRGAKNRRIPAYLPGRRFWQRRIWRERS